MTPLMHARYARLLIEACDGLLAAAEVCRVGKSQLSDYQSPTAEAFMPADVIADLERHCGRPIYSQALREAADPDQRRLSDLTAEVCQAVESAASLQRDIRLATSNGRLTPGERERLGRRHAAAVSELADVGRLLGES